MKYLLTIAVVTALNGFWVANAQKDSSGIYATADDYKNQKLSYAVNYKAEKHTIKSEMLFDNDKIKVKHKGTVYTLKKRETYGYRDTRGKEFRFVDNKEYEILNPGERILLYVYQHAAHAPKEAERYRPQYFFSVDAAAAPQALTKANLKEAFKDNHKFHDAIDASFRNDEDLRAYDSFHKEYKINRLLQANGQ